MWSGLLDGTIDLVVSDHSPAPQDLKCVETGDFMKAWGGISSLQLGIPFFRKMEDVERATKMINLNFYT